MVDHPAKARKARRRASGTGSRSGPAPFNRKGGNGGADKSAASLRKSFEKYVELAKARAQAGDAIESEKYYQYAEHFFRAMKGEAA